MIPAAAITTAALAGVSVLAACTSGTDNPSPHSVHPHAVEPSTSAVLHGGPMIPATATAPDYLVSPDPRLTTRAGTLPLVRSVASNTTGIAWNVISRDENSGVLTVDVDDGGCITVPFGYTATTYKDIVIIGIYSTSTLASGEACAGTGRLAVYRLVLPPADAKLSLAHAPYL